MKKSKKRRISTPPGEKNPRVGIQPMSIMLNIRRLLPFIIISLAYATLFILMRGKVLFTPDFNQSDAFHLYVSTKYHLWETLHRNTLPFWTQKLQGGFPLLAEGQTGALFLPNLVAYRLFSFPDAYAFSFAATLFLYTAGFYFLLRRSKIQTVLAFLISFSATFAGYISFRFVHLSIVQGLSLLPLLFVSAQNAYTNGTRLTVTKILHSFLIAQVFFAGHAQIAFISIFSLCAWYIFIRIASGESIRKTIISFAVVPAPLIITGIVLALPQILPSLQLMSYSSRNNYAGYDFATTFPFYFKQLRSFFTPYSFGNPKFHSYSFSFSEWGVFWENTPYIGEPLVILILSAVFVSMAKKTCIRNKGFLLLLLAGIFVLISFGPDSPLYFIFDIPPFSFFRTPARYLIPASFLLIWGGALYIREIYDRSGAVLKAIINVLLVVNVMLLVTTAFSYHLYIDAAKILDKGFLSVRLEDGDRYISLGYGERWNTYLKKNGWASKADISQFLRFNSSVIPESNFIYGGESFNINTGGLRFRRIDALNNYLHYALGFDDPEMTATASASDFLSIAGINRIISTRPLPGIDGKSYSLTGYKDGLYQYASSNGRLGYYIPERARSIRYLDELNEILLTGRISTGEAIIEGYRSFKFSTSMKVTNFIDTEQEFKATVSSPEDGFFVISKNWYPEWRVTVDGRRIDPVITNLIHMGIPLPPGTHEVSAVYVPYSFYTGVILAGLTCVLLVLLFQRSLKVQR